MSTTPTHTHCASCGNFAHTYPVPGCSLLRECASCLSESADAAPNTDNSDDSYEDLYPFGATHNSR